MKKTIAYFLIVGFALTARINIYGDPINKNPLYVGTLSGLVTEKSTGLGLGAASVYINDLRMGVITDSSAHYSFKNMPSGNYLVEVRHVGFKPLTRNVYINGAVIENFELQENVIEESEVVITGLSKATQIRRSPIPIVSINHNFIASNLNTN